MSDMIERVARALFRQAYRPSQNTQITALDAEESQFGGWKSYEKAARAAITAMQGDPGHDITEAVCKPTEDRRWAVNAWRAMIDAALK